MDIPAKKFQGKRRLPLLPVEPDKLYEYERHALRPINSMYTNGGGRVCEKNTSATPGELSWKPLCWHSDCCRQFGNSVMTHWFDGTNWHTLSFDDAIETEYWTKAGGWTPAYYDMKAKTTPPDETMIGKSKAYRLRARKEKATQ